MADEIRVVAYLRAKADDAQAVLEAAEACVEPTRAEPGNISYILHRLNEHREVFVFVEHWASQQALDEHMRTPHFQALAAAIDDKLSSPLEVNVLSPI